MTDISKVMLPGLREYRSAVARVAPADGVPEHMRAGMREILDVTASNPRKGHATALMTRICQEADRTATTLLLTAKPFQDGMTEEQLKSWYERFGFQQIQDEPVIMARQVYSGAQIVRH